MSATVETEVEVDIRCPDWSAVLPDAERLCRRAVHAALAAAAGMAAEVSVVLGDNAFVRDLNSRYRGRDAATNVLAFPVGTAGEGLPTLLGDVVVAYGTVAAEAAEQGKPIADHLSHLIVHGTLHLIGYDHDGDAEAAAMERLEIAALAALGIADPYVSGDTAAAPAI